MRTRNTTGIWAIIRSYPRQNLKKSIFWPAVFFLPVSIFLIRSEIDPLTQITFLCDTILSIIPNVLGFILSGYALIIGLTGTEIIQKISKKGSIIGQPSLFQTVNSTFAVVLIVLFATILIGFIVRVILNANLYIIPCLEGCRNAINLFVSLLLAYMLIYSFFSIKDIVVNVFNFGEFVHVINHIKNLQSKQASESDNSSDNK